MNTATVCGLVIVALVGYFLSAQACDCVPPERQPKNPGCKGEFMAILTITGKFSQQSQSILMQDISFIAGSKRKDEMELQLSYKLLQDGSPNLADGQAIANQSYLTTAENSALCGVYLEVNSTYLIRGQRGDHLHLNSCNSYIKRLDHIPDKSEAQQLFSDLVKRFC